MADPKTVGHREGDRTAGLADVATPVHMTGAT